MATNLDATPASLTFAELTAANTARLPLFKNAHGKPAHREPDGSDWALSAWCNATLGELGELANLVKKIERGDFELEESRGEVSREFGDVQIYLALFAWRAGVDLAAATIRSFDEKSGQLGLPIYLGCGPLRCGDIVKHPNSPGGELAVVAYDDPTDGIVVLAGWPAYVSPRAELEIVERVSDDRHFDAVLGWCTRDDKRDNRRSKVLELYAHALDLRDKQVERMGAPLAANACPPEQPGAMGAEASPSTAAELIRIERVRQVQEEGYDEAHDSAHRHGELFEAARCYIRAGAPGQPTIPANWVPADWPWLPLHWKPRDRLTNLVRAGALAQAEIERAARDGDYDRLQSAVDLYHNAHDQLARLIGQERAEAGEHVDAALRFVRPHWRGGNKKAAP